MHPVRVEVHAIERGLERVGGPHGARKRAIRDRVPLLSRNAEKWIRENRRWTMEITLLFLLCQSFLIVVCYNYYGILPFPTILVAYISICQLMYGLAHDGIAQTEMFFLYRMGGLEHNFVFTQLFYLGISAYVTLCCVVFRTRSRSRHERLTVPQLRKVVSRGTSAILLLVLAVQLSILVAVLNWDIVLRNDEYLLMTSPDAVIGDSSFLHGLFGSMTFVGPLAATMAAFSHSMKRPLFFAGFAIISVCYFLFLLSAHSRSAALSPVAFAAVLWMTGAERHWKAILFASTLAALSIVSGLAGRGGGVEGFASLPGIFANIFDGNSGKNIIDLLANICEGIFVTGEGFRVNESHPTLYKILSLSPAPSFVDGFAYINDAQQIRLHDYVPMSGFSEFYLFGFPYNMACVFIVTLAIYISMKLREINKTMFIVCNTMQFLSFYILNAYPIRNGLKPLWLVYLLALLVVPGLLRRSSFARRRRPPLAFDEENAAFPRNEHPG
jgi:hypothetical protein